MADAFERTVERVVKEPIMQRSGVSEENARRMMAPIAEREDKRAKSAPPPLRRKPEDVKVHTTRFTPEEIPVLEKIGERALRMEGLGPIRLSLSHLQPKNRKAIAKMHKAREERTRRMLGG